MTDPGSSDLRFAIAGDAACLLEELGFVAVARRRDGVVLLELWRPVRGEQRLMRHTVEGDVGSPERLARACAAQFDELASRLEG